MPRLSRALLTLFVLVGALAPGSVRAVPATFQFSGQVGVGQVDPALQSTGITAGMPVTVNLTLETSTGGIHPTLVGATYGGAITNVEFTIGSIHVEGPPASSYLFVLNDATGGDELEWTAYGLNSPIAGTTLSQVYLDFIDAQKLALSSTSLPTSAAWSEFENRAITISFLDGATYRNVGVNVTGAATPASSATWGRIKHEYR